MKDPVITSSMTQGTSPGMAAGRENENILDMEPITSMSSTLKLHSPGTHSGLLGANQGQQAPQAPLTRWNSLVLRKRNVTSSCRTLAVLGMNNMLLTICLLAMLFGFTAGALLIRFYFVSGGSRKWLYTWIQTAGWPLSALVIGTIRWKKNLKLEPISPKLGCAYLIIGGLTAIDNFMYAWGIAYMSASTNALLNSSQLIFNTVFACLLNRQKITAYSYNAVALVTTGAVILAVHSNSDTPPGVTKRQYIVAYIMTIAGAALYGFILPLTELVFRKFIVPPSNFAILQFSTYVCFIATVFATIGMAVNKDFSALHAESQRFKSGHDAYYQTIFWTTICFSVGLLGTMGVIVLSSALLAGVVIAASLPLASVFAVVFFHDNFGALKVISLFLCLWGFTSYIYGGYLDGKKSEVCETEMSQQV